ncbi:endonuclease NucS [Bifidobacterium sp. ESL0800]|uniref:endonuclease NucS n=1 Tax=Bifidobacterium sp. ESL0800 TaxID=2983236 RepID=UPI0023F981F9|nr:endonuclease NucS [Bifidobacterium sp. ESL0800]WEV75604.1 endonuclease NucS [Bifidobacterium sp. ESL0800]
MRIIVADCSAVYSGRLNASLPMAKRVLMIKADQSLLIFSELGSYKPLNWMAAPCTIREVTPENEAENGEEGNASTTPKEATETEAMADSDEGAVGDSAVQTTVDAAINIDVAAEPLPEKVFRVASQKSTDVLEVTVQHVYSDETYDLGEDPGLTKDGVEDHLQYYLAAQIERIGKGAKLVRREYPTPIGPVDIMAIDGAGQHVAIEIKRHGGIDGVEQLTRYVKLLNKDPLLAPVRGMFAAQTITPQAKVLATERGFDCLILDYEDMKGTDDDSLRLF